MAELKRVFNKGKMNKDLDERLLPAGEYKDGLNIEVTTSEGSDIGVVENIVGNAKLGNISFKEPFYDGEEEIIGRDGLPQGYGSSFPNAAITSFSSNAEVVGAAVDNKDKIIYSLVARTLDYETLNVGDGDGIDVEAGLRVDSILETKKDESATTGFVFNDIYEVKRPVGVVVSGKINIKTDPTGTTNTSPISTSDGTTVIRIQGTSFLNYLNGLEVGMVVEAVKPDGTNIWEATGEVELVAFTPTYVSPPGGSFVSITLSRDSGIDITSSNLNDGVILKFSKRERLLSFEPSTQMSFTNTNGDSITSATPIDNKITGVNYFDGLLYFTDGKTEPKKINIARSKQGTIGNTPYNKTDFIYQRYDGEWEKEDLELRHITVAKPNPLNPPRISMRNTRLKGQVDKIGVPATDFTSTSAGDTGTINIAANVEGETVSIALGTSDTEQGANRSIVADDRLILKSNGYEVYLKVTSSTSSSIGYEFIEANALYLESPPNNPSIKWEARLYESTNKGLHPDKPMWEKKFVRLAYRWRYVDGEISALSPFTEPCFLPTDRYNYTAKDSFNAAMSNDLRELTVSNFLPFSTPKEVVQVDIIAKEDGVQNLYLLKSVKREDYVKDDDGNVTYEFNRDAFSSGKGKGKVVITGSSLGSTLPSDQLLRPFDNVPRTAVAQTVSASRLIYANYKTGYDIKDKDYKNIQIDFRTPWNETKSLNSFSYKWGSQHSNGKFYGYPAIKSGRSYTVGVVYKDDFGRESSVLIGDNSTLDVGYQRRDQIDRIRLHINHNAPSWAKWFKFFIKESSAEYYNISLYAHYPTDVDGGNNASSVWLSFNSADRNKVQEGDFLIVKKAHSRYFDGVGGTDAVVSAMGSRKYKILDISNEVPDDVIPDTRVPEAEEKAGKFFVKVKLDRALLNALGLNPAAATWRQYWLLSGSGKENPNPGVFEVEPRESQDLDIFYEVPRCYPIELNKYNIYEWINPGDRVYVYYKQSDGGSIGLEDDFFVDSTLNSKNHYYNLSHSVTSIEPPSFTGDPAKIVLDSNFTLADQTGANQTNPGSIHIVREDGSKVSAYIEYSSEYASAGANVYIKPDTIHQLGFTLNFSNCFKFGNGVESDRILDDFNAPRLDNGVKVSTTSDNYKEETRGNGMIFSGIYNSKNGVNNLNQFISAQGITKDLNPQFGSIQILNARDTNITTVCEHKTVKVLANKDALFTASGDSQVTSTKNVLGQTVPYAGDFGIGTLRASFVSEEYRSYFVDPHRSAVMRLSNDGLTPISAAGMGDYFGDTLDSIEAAVGSYNRDKGEYDLTLHYDLDTSANTKKAETISYAEAVKGWTSFKSYIPDMGVSIDNRYYTFKQGDAYIHGETNSYSSNAVINRCNFYGVQYVSSVTTIFNDMPDLVKSFNTLNYEGTRARIVQELSDTDGGTGQHEHATYLDSAYGHAYNAEAEGFVSEELSPSVQFYNNIARKGWYTELITTDKQSGVVHEFIEKEGKWFNYIHGETTTFTNAYGSTNASGNLDTQEFSVQGLGSITAVDLRGQSFGRHDVKVTSTSSISGVTITGETITVNDGSNYNSITTLDLTITANSCNSFSSDDVSIDVSGISQISSVTIPSGQTIVPGASLNVDIVFASGTVSNDITFDLPVTISTVTDTCQDHSFDIQVDGPTNNYSYEISGLNDYTVYAPSYSGDDATFNVQGQSNLSTVSGINAQQTYSITFTADQNYSFDENDFDPTNTLDDASDWTNTEVYTYNTLGNPIAVTYTWSYAGQNPNPTSPLDLFVYPDVTMNDDTVSVTEDVSRDTTLRNVKVTARDGEDSLAFNNITVTDLNVDVLDDSNANEIVGFGVVFEANEGYVLDAATDFPVLSARIEDSTGSEVSTTDFTVAFSQGANNTVLGVVTFSSQVITGDLSYIFEIRESDIVTAGGTDHDWRMITSNYQNFEEPTITGGANYATPTKYLDGTTGSSDYEAWDVQSNADIGTTEQTAATVVIECDDDYVFDTTAQNALPPTFNVQDPSAWSYTYTYSANSNGDANGKLTIVIKYTGTGSSNTYSPKDSVFVTKFQVIDA